jgi:hypothetical protein
VLCQGNFLHKKHMEHTLVHELVHMYDHAVFNVDWSNLRYHACSEVCLARLTFKLFYLSFLKDSCEQFEWRLFLGTRNTAWHILLLKTAPGARAVSYRVHAQADRTYLAGVCPKTCRVICHG